MQLLERETLSEYEIKQLHKIRMQLPDNETANSLKNKIKQRLVVENNSKKVLRTSAS